MGGDGNVVPDICREEGDPDLGEAGEGKVPIVIEERGEATAVSSPRAKSPAALLKALMMSAISSLHKIIT